MGRDHLGVQEADETILLKCHLKKFVGGDGQDREHMGHMAGLVMDIYNFSVFEIFDNFVRFLLNKYQFFFSVKSQLEQFNEQSV